MRRRGFFRVIWRIDAVLILLVGLLVLGLLVVATIPKMRSGFTRVRTSDVVDPKESAAPQERLSLSGFQRETGTAYAVAQLSSTQPAYKFSLSSGSGENSRICNYLFVNLEDRSSHWLFPDNRRLIADKREICTPGLVDRQWVQCREVTWLAIESITEDTDGDGRLTLSDRRTLGFADSTGRNYQDVLKGADFMLGSVDKDTDNLVVFYSQGGRNYAAEVNIRERTVKGTTALAPAAPTVSR